MRLQRTTRGAQCAGLFALLCPLPLTAACTREQPEPVAESGTGVLEMIELDTVGPAQHGRRVKVHGYVMRDTIARRGDDEYRFDMARRGARLQVEYKGVLPQDFAEQREVIATGVLADDGTKLVASEVLSRCPEDYEELKRAPAG